jgi:hypothetical protein
VLEAAVDVLAAVVDELELVLAPPCPPPPPAPLEVEPLVDVELVAELVDAPPWPDDEVDDDEPVDAVVPAPVPLDELLVPVVVDVRLLEPHAAAVIAPTSSVQIATNRGLGASREESGEGGVARIERPRRRTRGPSARIPLRITKGTPRGAKRRRPPSRRSRDRGEAT